MTELTQQQQEEHNLAEEARQIVESPIVQRALATMEQGIYETWRDENLTPEQREELHRMSATLHRFIKIFDLHLQNGATARHILGLPPEEKTFFQRIKEYIHGNTQTRY